MVCEGWCSSCPAQRHQRGGSRSWVLSAHAPTSHLNMASLLDAVVQGPVRIGGRHQETTENGLVNRILNEVGRAKGLGQCCTETVVAVCAAPGALYVLGRIVFALQIEIGQVAGYPEYLLRDFAGLLFDLFIGHSVVAGHSVLPFARREAR